MHQLVVQHVVCAKHGEVVELSGHGHDSLADQIEVRLTKAADLHHGCSHKLLFLSGIVVLPPAIQLKKPVWPRATFPCFADAPRPVPLTYAPKTSPPLNC
jgi:hypothetical protein